MGKSLVRCKVCDTIISLHQINQHLHNHSDELIDFSDIDPTRIGEYDS